MRISCISPVLPFCGQLHRLPFYLSSSDPLKPLAHKARRSLWLYNGSTFLASLPILWATELISIHIYLWPSGYISAVHQSSETVGT